MNTELRLIIFLLTFFCTHIHSYGQDWVNVGPEATVRSGWNATGQMNVARFHPDYTGEFATGVTPGVNDNTYANALIAGSTTGGLFISYDGGTHWENLNTDQLPYSGSTDFEFAPYFSAGEPKLDYFNATSSKQLKILHQATHDFHRGSVIYKSTDQGTTWTDCGAPFSNSNALDVNGYFNAPNVINDIAVTPANSAEESTPNENKSSASPDKTYDLFVASNLGVHVSSDRGSSWSAATFVNTTSSYILPNNYHQRCWLGGPGKVVVDWNDNNNIYLSGHHEEGGLVQENYTYYKHEADFIYKSTNKGVSFSPWRKIYNYNAHNILSKNLKLTDIAGIGSTETFRDSFRITGTVIHQSKKNHNKLVLIVGTEYTGDIGNTSALQTFLSKYNRLYFDQSSQYSNDQEDFGTQCAAIFYSMDGGTSWTFSGNANMRGPYWNLFSSLVDEINDNYLYLGRGNEGKITRFVLSSGEDQKYPGSKRHPDFRDITMVALNTKKVPGSSVKQGFVLVANDGGMILNKNIHNWSSSSPAQFLRLKDTGLAVWRGYMVGVSQQVNGKLTSAGPDNGVWRKRMVNSQLKWTNETWGDGEHSKYNQHNDSFYTKMYSSNAAPSQVFRLNSPNGCWTGSSTFPTGGNHIFVRTPFESMKESGVTYIVSKDPHEILRSTNHGCPPFDVLATPSVTNIFDIALDEYYYPNLVMYALTNPTPAGTPNKIRVAYGFVNKNNSPVSIAWNLFNPNNPSPLDEKISDLVITHPYKKVKKVFKTDDLDGRNDETTIDQKKGETEGEAEKEPSNEPVEYAKNKIKVYISYHNYHSGMKVFSCLWNVTTNTYSNWSNESNGIPNTHVNCMIYDRCSNTLFVGTDAGVYYKKAYNPNAAWQKLGTKLPNMTVTDLEIQDKTGLLFASTFGRSMWSYDITGLVCPILTPAPNPPSEASSKSQDLLQEKKEDANVVTIFPNPTSELIKVDLSSYSSEINTSLRITDMQGKVVLQQGLKGNRIHEVQLPSLPSGTYLVNVLNEKGTPIHSTKIEFLTNSDQSEN